MIYCYLIFYKYVCYSEVIRVSHKLLVYLSHMCSLGFPWCIARAADVTGDGLYLSCFLSEL